MRILIVHTRYQQYGGEDSSVDNQLDLLRSAGHEVALEEFTNDGPKLNQAASLVRAGWNRSSAERVVAVANRLHPDVIHVHNTWFAASHSVPISLTRAGYPTVVTLHNYRSICGAGAFFRDGKVCVECLHGPATSLVKHRCYRSSTVLSTAAALTVVRGKRGVRLQNGVARVAVLSEFAKGLYVEAGLDPERIQVTRNSVPDPGPRQADAAESDELLFVGRDSPEKGLAFLLSAWRAYRQGLNSRLRLVLIGAPKDMSDPGLAIEATGPIARDDVLKRMSSARGLLFPSLCFENQPMVLLEALSCGLPILASDIGSTPEVFGSSAAGWLARTASLYDWKGGLRRFEDNRVVTDLGKAARARYVQNYKPEAQLQDLSALYAAAIRH